MFFRKTLRERCRAKTVVTNIVFYQVGPNHLWPTPTLAKPKPSLANTTFLFSKSGSVRVGAGHTGVDRGALAPKDGRHLERVARTETWEILAEVLNFYAIVVSQSRCHFSKCFASAPLGCAPRPDFSSECLFPTIGFPSIIVSETFSVSPGMGLRDRPSPPLDFRAFVCTCRPFELLEDHHDT